MRKLMEEGLKKFGIELSEDKIDKLMKYKDLLLEKNKIVNLTAMRDEADAIEKHFIDSVYLYKYIVGEKNKKAVDVGTGAGFPGMVLAIAAPEIEFTLLDSIGKKTKFLEEVKEELNIDNVKIVNMRSEDFIKEKGVRESFDYGFARAVAELRIISEYIIPFVKVNGKFYPQKADYKPEIENAENALKLLGSEITNIDEFALPFSGDRRAVLEITKTTTTDNKYPRRAGVPEKRPL